MKTHYLRRLMVVVIFCCFAAGAYAQDAAERYWNFDPSIVQGFKEGSVRDDIVPGEFIVDPPTLENLGFRWYVEGDSNRNSSVALAYRKKGAAEWSEALPMLRVHDEIVDRSRYQFPDHPEPQYRDIINYFRTGNLFAGSVLFLEPGTEYEVRFTMTDRDGGAPAEPKIISVATRAEAQAAQDGRMLHVYPANYQGEIAVQGPVFDDIKSAFDAAQPGDVILLHAGTHEFPETTPPETLDLAPGQNWGSHTPPTAVYHLTKSGEEGRPIVFRGEGSDKTIVEGRDHGTDLFDVTGANNLIFEEMTLRRAHTAFRGGAREKPGASWITVRRCRIEEVINGLWTFSENSSNWTVSDNVITGIDEKWHPRTSPGVSHVAGSHTGVNVYGQGHVVCHNRISRFSDSIAIADYNIPSVADPRKLCVNMDFYNNDLSWAADDTIEADYGCHNIRIYNNLCYNAHTGLSVQPAFGGPIYLIRNVAYGITYLSYKWNNQPAGIVAYHNTTASSGAGFSTPPWSNSHLRNNLILGNGTLIASGTLTPERSTMDYDGFSGNGPVRWMHGRAELPNRDQEGRVHYETLAEFTAATGLEKHAVRVNFDGFVKAAPVETGRTYTREDFDLRLRPESNAVDAGARLPNINDDFTGAAPDLGAYELGKEAPLYGPRVDIPHG